MANSNLIYEWEGDATQALNPFTFKCRKEMFPDRVRFIYARVLFEQGNLDDYYALVAARNDVIKRNLAKIAEGTIDGVGGRVGGGFWFGEVAVAGDELEDVPDEPVYAGDLSLSLKVYVDGTLENTISVYNQKPFRIGVPKRSTEWDFELVGNVDKVHQLDVVSSMAELTGTKDTALATLKTLLEE